MPVGMLAPTTWSIDVTTYPVLTLWEPWASLIACGVKTIETRSWKAPDKIIGQTIAIHAAKRKPYEDQRVGDWIMHEMADDSWAMTDEDRPTSSHFVRLPLGAIVATARLVECLPITERTWPQVRAHTHEITVHPPDMEPRLLRWYGDELVAENISDQRPYGDFAPGRWAWILDQVEPVDPPVLFVGGQGFSKQWHR